MWVYHRIFLVILFFICLIFSYRVAAAQNLDGFPAKRDPATNLSTEREKLIKEAGGKIPQIILEPTTFNFGRISKKEGKAQRIFKLYNKGTAKLIITNLRVSCTCTTVSLKLGKKRSPDFGIKGAENWWKETIEAGSFGELEVVLDLAHPSMAVGKQIRDIFIESNDPLYPQVTLRVEVEVIE